MISQLRNTNFFSFKKNKSSFNYKSPPPPQRKIHFHCAFYIRRSNFCPHYESEIEQAPTSISWFIFHMLVLLKSKIYSMWQPKKEMLNIPLIMDNYYLCKCGYQTYVLIWSYEFDFEYSSSLSPSSNYS